MAPRSTVQCLRELEIVRDDLEGTGIGAVVNMRQAGEWHRGWPLSIPCNHHPCHFFGLRADLVGPSFAGTWQRRGRARHAGCFLRRDAAAAARPQDTSKGAQTLARGLKCLSPRLQRRRGSGTGDRRNHPPNPVPTASSHLMRAIELPARRSPSTAMSAAIPVHESGRIACASQPTISTRTKRATTTPGAQPVETRQGPSASGASGSRQAALRVGRAAHACRRTTLAFRRDGNVLTDRPMRSNMSSVFD